ncbi:unnamed protein product [Soboliphyme baturini]|uniref:GOLGA2L5 domain-containing protein n=1 Tax=Soboliphyme baturini TaxID=241478 RepID=A0A183J0L4_9BILA|nr:unnamed protein product [Soboliphyme baturini]
MDAPEVDKELKRLLRADMEAVKVRWELISTEEENKQKSDMLQGHISGSQPTGVSTLPPDNFEASEKTASLREDEIFGGAVSSSSGSEGEEVAEGRQLAHQLMKSVDENSNSTDSAKPPLTPARMEIQHLQSDLIEYENQMEVYQSQLAALENPILKARLQEEIEKHMKKEQELKQRVKSTLLHKSI